MLVVPNNDQNKDLLKYKSIYIHSILVIVRNENKPKGSKETIPPAWPTGKDPKLRDNLRETPSPESQPSEDNDQSFKDRPQIFDGLLSLVIESKKTYDNYKKFEKSVLIQDKYIFYYSINLVNRFFADKNLPQDKKMMVDLVNFINDGTLPENNDAQYIESIKSIGNMIFKYATDLNMCDYESFNK